MARGLWTRLNRLQAQADKAHQSIATLLGRLKQDPAYLMRIAGMDPDPWQEELLRSTAGDLLLLCCRQAGKSSVAAALALRVALIQPHSLVLLLSPSLRQSGELFRKVLDGFQRLGRPLGVRGESAARLELANGSRILSLPGTEGTIRGFSGVSLLVLDEAARVEDALYYAVRPMLGVSRGRLIALSTPFGKRGWFHDEWQGEGDWQRVQVQAPQCPRIAADFLQRERQALGERWYRQEYLCSFEDSTDAVFAYEDIQAAMSQDVEPLFASDSP